MINFPGAVISLSVCAAWAPHLGQHMPEMGAKEVGWVWAPRGDAAYVELKQEIYF